MSRYFVEELTYESETVPGRTCTHYVSRPISDSDDSQIELSPSLLDELRCHPGATYTTKIIVRDTDNSL